MAVDENLRTEIEENAEGPKKATSDQGSVEQHSLKDQIAADRYLKTTSASAAKAKMFGAQFGVIKAPGAEG